SSDFCEAAGSSQTCTFQYRQGTPLFLQATWPMEHSAFLGWQGACSGQEGFCNFTIEAPGQVTATFRGPQTLTVVVESVDNGIGFVLVRDQFGVNGACNGEPGTTQTCTFQHVPGATVDLAALGINDSAFAGWTGACAGTDPRCSITISGPTQV